MISKRAQLILVAAVLLVVAGGVGFVVSWKRGVTPLSIPIASQADKPEIGDLLGHVVRIDPERGEIVGDFGLAKGVERGMKVRVYRPATIDPANLSAMEWREYRGEFEITAAGEKESTARRVSDPGHLRQEDRKLSRLGDEIVNATDPVGSRLLALATGDDPDAIRELTQARLTAARKWLEIAKPYVENGSLNQDRLIQASRGVMEAERDAASSTSEEIAAIEAHLERMTGIIEQITRQTKLESEGPTGPNAREARAEQAAAALMLARARRGKLPSR